MGQTVSSGAGPGRDSLGVLRIRTATGGHGVAGLQRSTAPDLQRRPTIEEKLERVALGEGIAVLPGAPDGGSRVQQAPHHAGTR